MLTTEANEQAKRDREAKGEAKPAEPATTEPAKPKKANSFSWKKTKSNKLNRG